jgi:hypothetical protein
MPPKKDAGSITPLSRLAPALWPGLIKHVPVGERPDGPTASERSNVLRSHFIGTLIATHLVLDSLAFGQHIEAVVGDRAVVEEDIISTILGLNEAEAPVINDSCDTSLRHFFAP